MDGVDGHMGLLYDEDFGGQVAGLVLLGGREVGDLGVDEEDIGELVQVVDRGVGLLVDIAVEADVPSGAGPIGVGVDVQDVGGQCGHI